MVYASFLREDLKRSVLCMYESRLRLWPLRKSPMEISMNMPQSYPLSCRGDLSDSLLAVQSQR